MGRLSLLTTSFVLMFGLIAGCDSISGLWQDDGSLDTHTAVSVTVDGLAVHLFAPDTVVVADSFEVRVVVQNRTYADQSIRTPNSCLVRVGIFTREGSRVPFKGSTTGCFDVITTHEIPADDTVERRNNMQAMLSTTDGNEPVSPGTYVVRVEFDWTIDEDKAELKAIEREIVVR